jgi:2-(1,2-epoxy-1,2-dihydrophenyl)acetyl-CoA isomerase
MPDTDSPVTLSVADGIARLRLNRPDAANAVDLDLAIALERAVAELAADGSLRVVVLTGAGNRFCGGGDVRAFAAQPRDRLGDHLGEITAHLHPAVLGLVALDAPVVAAVRGSAAGAGLGLVLAADIVVAARSARFGMAYTAIGFSPDGSSSWFLPRVVGHRRALELTLTNRLLAADEACEWGMVTTVVDDDALDGAVDDLAAKLASGPTRAYGRAARLLRDAWTTPLDRHLDAERAALVASGGTGDGYEGVSAFTEKRPPRFAGT